MKNKNNITIAKRYANSLISMIKEQESNDLSLAFENAITILKNSADLNEVILNPVVSALDKESIIDSVFKQDTNETMLNFLKLLVRKNRFDLIFSINDEKNT